MHVLVLSSSQQEKQSLLMIFPELDPHPPGGVSGCSPSHVEDTIRPPRCPNPAEQGQPARLPGLISLPLALRGWPHHEYAGSGLSHIQKEDSAFYRSNAMATRPAKLRQPFDAMGSGALHKRPSPQHRHHPGILLMVFLKQYND